MTNPSDLCDSCQHARSDHVHWQTGQTGCCVVGATKGDPRPVCRCEEFLPKSPPPDTAAVRRSDLEAIRRRGHNGACPNPKCRACNGRPCVPDCWIGNAIKEGNP
jgi:hypothetical protein